jgi:hypothetical protein
MFSMPKRAIHLPRIRIAAAKRPRRGTAYLLVLGAGILLSVIGFGIMTAARSNTRTASQAADMDEAAMLAESAAEWEMAYINQTTSWRSSFTSGVETTALSVGRGTMSAKLVDETDGNLSNNSSDAVRLYGIGRVGSATRIFSIQLTGGGASLDVLSSAAHAAGNLSVTDNLTVIGGPISSNGTLSVTSGKTVTGDAKATTITGTVSGTKTTLSSPLTMPPSSVFDTYQSSATTLAFTSLSSGSVSKKVLGPGVNTWYSGAPTATNGVYYVHVPSTGTLTISTSRLLATLVVELDAGGKFVLSGANAWDPPRTDYPALIIKGGTGSTVSLGGSSSTLSETLNFTNFNPTGMPNSSGVTDSDTSDTYPSEFHGLLHVIGSSVSSSMLSSFTLKGAAIFDGSLSTATSVKLTLDTALATSPPQGYTGSTQMTPVAGSWKWEKSP